MERNSQQRDEPTDKLRIEETMALLEGDEKKIAIIRQAERPEFSSLENENNLGITCNGRKAAIQLGEAMASAQKRASFQVFSWGSRRVIETAQAISAGMSQTGNRKVEVSSAVFESPIKNREEYEKAFALGHWNEFIKNWLKGDGETSQSAFLPVQSYAKKTYKALLGEKFCSPGKITILVTHDLHIMPLVKFAFPSFCSWLDYLDGIVIRDYSHNILVGFDGMVASTKRVVLTS
jgi:hypothetical protein